MSRYHAEQKGRACIAAKAKKAMGILPGKLPPCIGLGYALSANGISAQQTDKKQRFAAPWHTAEPANERKKWDSLPRQSACQHH